MFCTSSLIFLLIVLTAALPAFAQAGDDPTPTQVTIWDANVVDVLDIETGEILFTLELDEEIEILGALLNTEQTRLLIWTETEAYLWELQPDLDLRLTSDEDETEVTLLTFTPDESILYALWSEDDTQIMTVIASQTRLIWDAETGDLVREINPTRSK